MAAEKQSDSRMAETRGYVEDRSGNNSSMRLNSFLALVASIIFGALTILLEPEGTVSATGIYITFGFLIAAFAPKTVQKFAENQLEKYNHPK